MGITIADSSAVGYYLNGRVTSNRNGAETDKPPVFTPTYRRRAFTFNYDPAANNGVGRVVYTLDGKEYAFDLSPAMRKEGATFNRFGFANVRSGGHSVEAYLDDLTYTARRDPQTPRKRYEQEVLPVPYPHKHGGRRF